jgi:hypothetical protein
VRLISHERKIYMYIHVHVFGVLLTKIEVVQADSSTHGLLVHSELLSDKYENLKWSWNNSKWDR